MNAILVQVISSALTGVLAWVGGQLLIWYKSRAAQPQPQYNQAAPLAHSAAIPPYYAHPGYTPSSTPPSTPMPPVTVAQPPSVNFGLVLKQVGILQFTVNVVAFIIGVMVGVIGANQGASQRTTLGVTLLLILLIGTLLIIAAFFLFGRRLSSVIRWRHLTYVAVGTIILTVTVNSLLAQRFVGVFAILGACIQTFMAMGIGGGLATLIAPNKPAQPPLPVRMPVPVGATPQWTSQPNSTPGYGAPQGQSQSAGQVGYPPPPYNAAPNASPGYPGYPANPPYQPQLYPPQAAQPTQPAYPYPPVQPGQQPAFGPNAPQNVQYPPQQPSASPNQPLPPHMRAPHSQPQQWPQQWPQPPSPPNARDNQQP